MKRKMQKLMGVGLTVVLLVSMLVAVAPASAGTLGFSVTTDIPDATNKMVITADSEITDIAVATGGERIYTATFVQVNETATGTVTTILAGGVDTAAEVFAVTYTNQDGVGLKVGSISFAENAAALVTATLTLAAGDTGIQAITLIAVTASDVTSGVISIAGDTSGTVLATWTVTGAGVGTPAYPAVVPAGTNSAPALYKSSDGGTSWSAITLPTAYTGAVNMVAVAPDDEDIVVVAGNIGSIATNLTVYASTDAGANWNALGTVQSATGTVAATQLNDLAVSAMSGSTHYVALAGRSGAGPGAYYFNLGATAPVWKNACITLDFTAGYAGAALAAEEFFAVAFSPNFPSDMVMIIVGDSQTAVNDPVQMHIASFNQSTWDAAVFAGYPVDIRTPALGATNTVTKADIAVDPEYLGGDDTTRTVFVGLTYAEAGGAAVATEIGDVFRMKDTVVKDLAVDVQINSVAWDGTNLAAGAYLTNNVYRSEDALVTTPTVSASRGYKEIGVDDATANDSVIVRWSGDTLVGGKIGAAAGFGKSTDNGKVWNGVTLIESALTTMRDVWVKSDGSVVYLLSDDGAEVSLWRKADSAWSRVFCFADATSTGYIVRAADSDPDVVYIAERLTKIMYYSTTGGTEKWTVRASRYTIQDVAVESADIAYVGESGTAKVSKTTNGGFTWGTTVSTSLGAGNIHSMTLLSADNLLVGSTLGCVAYTTDGNTTWNDLDDDVTLQALPVQVTASGLADGDYIFASTTTAAATDANVERWQIGTSTAFKDMADTMGTAVTAGTGSDDLGCFGIDYQDGVLYVLASDGTDSAIFRNANTESATPAAGDWTVNYELLDTFNNAPSAMRLSTGSSTLLWAVESTATELHTFTDSLVGVPPTLVFPAENYQNPVNPVSGASMDLAFKWEKPISGTAGYQIKVCSDAAGDVALTTHAVATSESGTRTVLMGPNQLLTQIVQFAPGQTYYWTVRVSTPAIGPWAPIQSFTIETLQAAVPQVLAPVNGAQDASTTPSFSWAPISGTTEYRFKLADNVALANSIVDVKVKTTGYALATKELDKGSTYYWAVMPVAPVEGAWSAIANFTVAEDVVVTPPAPPVKIEQVPAPVINLPAPPPQPADIIIPPAPPAPAPITPAYIWAIIIIGAVLVIAVIVLIVRTRRTV